MLIIKNILYLIIVFELMSFLNLHIIIVLIIEIVHEVEFLQAFFDHALNETATSLDGRSLLVEERI